jgi:hypothetical protein
MKVRSSSSKALFFLVFFDKNHSFKPKVHFRQDPDRFVTWCQIDS